MKNKDYPQRYNSSHEVYLAANGAAISDNVDFQELKNKLKSNLQGRFDSKRSDTAEKHLHLTIAFATSMPVDRIETVRNALHPMPKVKLVLDRLCVMGDRVALKATNVPEELKQYAKEVKQIMKKHGCQISYEDSFVAHLSVLILWKRDDADVKAILNKMSAPQIEFEFDTVTLIDRTKRKEYPIN